MTGITYIKVVITWGIIISLQWAKKSNLESENDKGGTVKINMTILSKRKSFQLLQKEASQQHKENIL